MDSTHSLLTSLEYPSTLDIPNDAPMSPMAVNHSFPKPLSFKRTNSVNGVSSMCNNASPRSLFGNRKNQHIMKHSQFESSDNKKDSDDMDFSDDNSSDFAGQDNKKKSLFSSFAKRMTDDFDMRKVYEDTLLKILNEYSRETVRNPNGAEEFRY